MINEVSVQSVLSENGILQQNLDNCKFRPAQLEMATAIELAIESKSKLIIEAATGTGKTFAYLVPAILSGKKIVISTGTKNLQDQLFKKDLPQLIKILKRPIKIALLKGRSNYLCKRRIELHQHDNQFFSKQIISELYKINLWQNQTTQGDKAEINFIAENSEVWPLVSSNKDNCIGQDCDYIKNCFLAKARRQAIAADIIIINHYLFFADLMIKESGFGELLPEAEAVIFDEAHQLPEIAGLFLGKSLSSNRILELGRDITTEIVNHAKTNQEVIHQVELLKKLIFNMRLSFGTEPARKPWSQICHKQALVNTIGEIKNNISNLRLMLEKLCSVSKGLAACHERLQEIEELFIKVTQPHSSTTVHWYETFTKSFVLHLTPLDIAPEINKLFMDSASWIFTSATLATNNSFSFYQNQMGLASAKTLQIESHYDYLKQAKLYLPKNLPLPSSPVFTEELVNAVIPIIQCYQGRTFFLFTSHSALHNAAKLLQNKLNYPLLIQGEKPKAALIND